jgi:hypothetical protein
MFIYKKGFKLIWTSFFFLICLQFLWLGFSRVHIYKYLWLAFSISQWAESRAVFLNRRAMSWYRALASIIPGPRLIKEEFTGPRPHKGWERLI